MRSVPLAARAPSCSSGRTKSRNCSNGFRSRKNDDSLVVIASTTSRTSSASRAAAQRGDELVERLHAAACAPPAAAGSRADRPCRCASTRPERSLSRRQRRSKSALFMSAPRVASFSTRRADLGERQHGAAQPGHRDRAGHAPDDAGRLVLGDDACRRSATTARPPAQAVMAHAGQHDGSRTRGP